MNVTLDNMSFTRSPQQAFMSSPLLARDNSATEPGEPPEEWEDRQLDNAVYVLYVWNQILVIVGTFAERVCLFNGTTFEFPLTFHDACCPFDGGFQTDLQNENYFCHLTRQSWDVVEWEGKLVIAGHFNHVNDIHSPAGVICRDADGQWRDMSDGLPALSPTTQNRLVRLYATSGSSLLIQHATCARNYTDPHVYGTSAKYELDIGSSTWRASTLSQYAWAYYDNQAHGSYSGPGSFPYTGWTYGLGGFRWSAGRWSSYGSIWIVSTSGPSFWFYDNGVWVGLGNNYLVRPQPGGSQVTFHSGFVWGSGSTWTQLTGETLGCNWIVAAKRGEYCVYCTSGETGRLNRSLLVLNRFDWPETERDLRVTDMVDFMGCVYAGGYFRRSGQSTDYQYPLSLIMSATYGATWIPAVGRVPKES